MASNGIESMQLGEDQIKILEENFNKVSKHPDESTLMLIAAESGLTEEETAVLPLSSANRFGMLTPLLL
uniref:Homeodomain-only protein n=1 Tax=Oncorhynchus mykiss TaxID=8022 RepID=A0A8K9XSE6_ONCMY